MQIASLIVSIDAKGACLSLRSILDKLALVGDRLELVVDFADQLVASGHERSDLFRCEPVDPTAERTGQIQGLQILPGDRYRELVSALADKVECNVTISHGWPILSVGDRTPTVTEGRRGVDPFRLEAPTMTGRDTGGKSA